MNERKRQWWRDGVRALVGVLFPSVAKLSQEVEQLRVQLAGCAVAAHGGLSKHVRAERGQYGWSPAYQDVVDLREQFEQLRQQRLVERHALAKQLKSVFALSPNDQAVCVAAIVNELNGETIKTPEGCPTCGQRIAYYAQPRAVKR